jgi:cysteine-rich repeat protein
VTLLFDVEFHHGALVPSPLNLGAMPLIALDTSRAHGALLAETTVQQAGAAPPNMSFPEFKVELNASTALLAALEGGMRLSFANATTELLPPDASATQVRLALQALSTVGEIEVFRTQSARGLAWRVRFYAVGEPAHIGPQPPLFVDASNLTLSSAYVSGVGAGASARRRLAGASVSALFAVATENAGESPFDPTDSSEEALLASSATLSDEAAANGTANGALTATAITYVTPVHVCGNGIRSTAEGCDDNNTAGGDGCSALCKIEAGFHCTSTTEVAGGSGIGGFDTCSPTCGDGKNVPWSALDECDDNNTMSGDGCSAGCLIEAGYACSGGSMTAMDTCASVCGDGLRVGAESCDDGNRVSLDGCNANCAIEDGFTCSGGSANSSDTCVTCHASCATCSGPSEEECVACASSHPFFSAPGTCLASCLPIAKYADSSNVCKPCDGACGTCSGATSSDCVSCTSASTPFLDAGTCVAECPSTGTYSGAIGLVAACLACDSTCKACGGPGSTDCVSCPAAGTPFFDAGTCVSVCPSGKYASANNACVVCNSLCSECSDGTATGCTNCLTGGAFDSIAGTCTYSCPIGQFLHSDGLRCANCDSTCRTCIAAGSCTSCDTGSTFPVYHSDACISVCPDGTHADSSSRCQACDASCATCLGGTATDCIACDSATPYKHGSTCLAACPTGSYAGGNSECATCDGSCAECDGSSTSSCTACPTFAPFLLGGACLSACPSTHYAESGSACGACDDSCVTCSGPGTNGCTSCAPATPHLEGGACACMAGYEATSDACTQVDECATGTHDCFGGAAHCTDLAGSFSCTCPKGYTGDGVSCVDLDECTAGTALCSAHATCANAPPSPAAPLGYMCTCNTTGYWGDGFFCGDVDECTLEAALPTASPHGCHPTARCINLDGAFDCACASGYRAYYGVSGYHNETVAWRL